MPDLDLNSQMRLQLRQLLLEFEAAQQIPHQAEKGRLLEISLARFLEERLPERLTLATGQIFGSRRTQTSRQIDLILYDSFNFPTLAKSEAYHAVIAESAIAAIEIKSRLGKKELIEASKVAASVGQIQRYQFPGKPPILTALVSYRTRWKKPLTLLRNLAQIAEKNFEHLPALICSLDPSYLLFSSDALETTYRWMFDMGIRQKNQVAREFPNGSYVLLRPSNIFPEDSLGWFYLLLVGYANDWNDIAIKLGLYQGSTMYTRTIINLEDYIREA